MRCDHCGMDKAHAQAAISRTHCDPPFVFQRHSFTGSHPADRKDARNAEPGDRWYRGWEVGYDDEAAKWTNEGWRAYKGGCDLDALSVSAASYDECLDAIDEQEDD